VNRRSFLAAIAAALTGAAIFRPWPLCSVCGRVRAMKIFAPDRPWIPPTFLPCQRCQSKQALAALYASGRSMFNPRENLHAQWMQARINLHFNAQLDVQRIGARLSVPRPRRVAA
jgi:hypothetical protein